MQSNLERALQLQLEMVKIIDYETEYKFYIDGKRNPFRFDFCWPHDDVRLVVEVEGGTWTNGRHTRGSGFEKDCFKYNEASIAGWTVLRVTANQVRSGLALHWIERYLVMKEKISEE